MAPAPVVREGGGRQGGPEAPVTVSAEADREQVLVEVAGRRISVQTCREGDLVVAAALLPGAEERR